MRSESPLPGHYDSQKSSSVWKVGYQELAELAASWRKEQSLAPASRDEFRICLLAVDLQNTFCVPGFELFVGGRSGKAAVEDCNRLCEFIYRNIALITQIFPTMDSHQAYQIFHSVFLEDRGGNHPLPFTTVSPEDIENGKWKISSAACDALGLDQAYLQRHLLNYSSGLKTGGKYDWTIWPFHAILGGIGHALVSSFEEAVFFHSIARASQPNFQVKGLSPLTEHYSVFGPEVLRGPGGEELGVKNLGLVDTLSGFDMVIVAGQAKSHCVAWTISDLLSDQLFQRHELASRFYLLQDCTSPVVIPGVVDYADEADLLFQRFEEAGMHLVDSTVPISEWL